MSTYFNLPKFAQDVFDEAQRIAPEASGQLKESANLMVGAEGFAIIYDIHYAYNTHENKPSPVANKEYVSKIPQHRRQLEGRTVIVKAHEKKYKKGFKPRRLKKGGLFEGKSGEAWTTQNLSAPQQKTLRVGNVGWVQQAYRNIRSRLAFRDKVSVPKELLIREYRTQKAVSSGGLALIATMGGEGKNMQPVIISNRR